MALAKESHEDNGSSKWERFRVHGIAFPANKVPFINGNADGEVIFVGVDVEADGNCFYRCIEESGTLCDFGNYASIRQNLHVFATLGDPDFAVLAYNAVGNARIPLEEYLKNTLKPNGGWAGIFEMLCVLKAFDINIVSFTCLTDGISVFNTQAFAEETLKLVLLKAQRTTTYIYHHRYGLPGVAGSVDSMNHFCRLVPEQSLPLHDRNQLNPEITLRPYKPTTRRKKKQCTLLSLFTSPSKSTNAGNGKRKRSPISAAIAKLHKVEVKRAKKVEKEATLLRFLDSMQIDEIEASRLRKIRLQRERLEQVRVELEVAVVIEQLVVQVELEDRVQHLETDIVETQDGGSRCVYSQRTWRQRALVACYFLHPLFGNNNYVKTSEIFSVPVNTLKPWIQRPALIQKWIEFANGFSLSDIINSIPLRFRQLYSDLVASLPPENILPQQWKQRLAGHSRKLFADNTATPNAVQYITFNRFEDTTVQKALAKAKQTPGMSYLTVKRKNAGNSGRP